MADNWAHGNVPLKPVVVALGLGCSHIGLMRSQMPGCVGLCDYHSSDFVLPTCSSKAGQASRRLGDLLVTTQHEVAKLSIVRYRMVVNRGYFRRLVGASV